MRIYGLREGFKPVPKDAVDIARRDMHNATCAECGKQCQVPFKPDSTRPVYCGDCYQKHRPATGTRTGRAPRRY